MKGQILVKNSFLLEFKKREKNLYFLSSHPELYVQVGPWRGQPDTPGGTSIGRACAPVPVLLFEKEEHFHSTSH